MLTYRPRFAKLADNLRWVSVYNINIAVGRDNVSNKHWIYFPERQFPFYRVGFPMNFSPALGRPGAVPCMSKYRIARKIEHRPRN